MSQSAKPRALRAGDAVRVLSLASPVEEDRLKKGCEEIARLGYKPTFEREQVLARDGFFAGRSADRLSALKRALSEHETRGIFCARGGYGSNYILECFDDVPAMPKLIVGYSDITSLQIYLWQELRWITLYGPMVAAGLDAGAGSPNGYDRDSFLRALTETGRGWSLDLAGESINAGVADGIVLGGCLTLLETTIGTPWELDTRGAILILEDRGMKPYQIDRALMHLKQAGKFEKVSGVMLGDFPECDMAGVESIREIAGRILCPLGIPVVYGAPIGHTTRPMLTIPLGVRGRLSATGSGQLEILEPAAIL